MLRRHYQTCSLLTLALATTLVHADPPASSAYVTDPQSSHVEDATSSGVGQVNMITCIMASMKPDALVNQGNYNALVDESKCDPEGPSSNQNGTQSTSFLNAVVNATRASNTEPMISRIWIEQEEEGHKRSINVRVAASEAPSTPNPYGVFRLDFCGTGDDAVSCVMNGYLEGSTSGVRYYETEQRTEEQGGAGTETRALRLNASGTTAGSGRMQLDSRDGQGVFDFAYNANLFRRSDGTEDQCFSRDATDPDTGMSVWRYGLYDATTGVRVTRNSGFPIEYQNSGTTHRGYLGYYGLQLPAAAMDVLANGSTVRKVDYSAGHAPATTDYTVVKSAGKLTKYTRQTRTLRTLDKIKFSTFVGNNATDFFAGATPNAQYELYWDDAAGGFKVTAQMNCSQNGCQSVALPQPQAVAASFWQNQGGVQGWSQSLGGELFIRLQNATQPLDSASVNVAYRTQDLVYPSQLPATLHCVRDCPTSASLAAYFAPNAQLPSPFAAGTFNNFTPSAANTIVTYHTDAATTLVLDTLNQPVTFSDAEAYRQHSQYQYGVRSGRLFTTLADAECASGSNTYCDWRVNDSDIYYQWETGAGNYNQFAAVKDASGQFVAFDAPLQVTFDVPNGVAYGEYAGQSLVLQYGGYGDLWGIPGQCVSRSTNAAVSCDTEDARYVAAFVIPYNTTAGRVTNGSTTYLVKWLDREIRFARKDASVCSAAGLNLPAGLVLPTAADLRNPSNPSSDIYIGVKPELNQAPRVINGEVKF